MPKGLRGFQKGNKFGNKNISFLKNWINGITLNDKAHKEFHKKYGNKNNTKEQLEEFLCRSL